MEWLFIFGLAGTVAYLWNRLDRAERRLDGIDRVQEYSALMLRDLVERRGSGAPEGEDERAAAHPRPSVPSVAKHARGERQSARVVGSTAPPEPVAPDIAAEAFEPGPAVEEAQQASFVERFIPGREFDFEDIFGRRLPIWAGGVALAVAGIFLVRYAIEAGLLTPAVRVALAFLFGIGLLAGAETAFRFKERIADPRVAQALAGAGLATLYAGFYLAGSQYGLIGQTFAFLGLASVTALAIALSFRFGLPSAVLGLVGGFAAPALVGGEDANLPLLALYLGLVTAGLTLSGRQQRRPFLGIAALVGGLGWGALLLVASEPRAAEILALGLYFITLGAVLPALAGAEIFEKPLRLISAGVASVQLALLVDQGGYSPLAWGLYLLMGAALAVLGWCRTEVREANGVAALVGLLLFAQWISPDPVLFAAVGTGLAAVFAAVPLALTWRKVERPFDLWQLGLVPPAIAAVAYSSFGEFAHDTVEAQLALATALLALFPLGGTWQLRDAAKPAFFAALLGSGMALVFAALLMVTPGWMAPLAAIAVLAGPTMLTVRRNSAALRNLLWIGAVITGCALAATSGFFDELERLGGFEGRTQMSFAVLRWLAATLPFAALAMLEARMPLRRIAEAIAALLAYGLLAQVLPERLLAWSAAGLAIGLWYGQRPRIAAQAALGGVTLLWAAFPLADWLVEGGAALVGKPLFVDALQTPLDVLTRILPLTATLLVISRPLPALAQRAWDSRILAAPVLFVAAHIFFKQLFAIDSMTRFVDFGLAERTLWQALLLGSAWLALRGLPRIGASRTAAIVLVCLSFAHFAVFTLFWHNPLFDRQAVGPAPVANLALAAYAVAIGMVISLRQWLPPRAKPVLDGLAVALVSLGALTLLRQGFAGTILIDRMMTQTEDLVRSLLGILLAFGFLFLGARRNERSWRVGSLVLMLLAVAKVFIYDAAGLEGLLRIASFMALGFALIAIGWLYARQLKPEPCATDI